MASCEICGLKHARNNCKAYGKRCGIREMFNHFARMCKNNGKMVYNLETEEHVEYSFVMMLWLIVLIMSSQWMVN